MLATYKRGTDGGIVRACDEGGTSEHKEGRAWDWMLDVHNPQDAAVASAVLQFLLAPGPHGEPAWNARRLGIMYIIWDGADLGRVPPVRRAGGRTPGRASTPTTSTSRSRGPAR